jgi:hypothetical protein
VLGSCTGEGNDLSHGCPRKRLKIILTKGPELLGSKGRRKAMDR